MLAAPSLIDEDAVKIVCQLETACETLRRAWDDAGLPTPPASMGCLLDLEAVGGAVLKLKRIGEAARIAELRNGWFRLMWENFVGAGVGAITAEIGAAVRAQQVAFNARMALPTATASWRVPPTRNRYCQPTIDLRNVGFATRVLIEHQNLAELARLRVEWLAMAAAGPRDIVAARVIQDEAAEAWEAAEHLVEFSV